MLKTPSHRTDAPLAACPFCGAAPTWERFPADASIVRIACVNRACGVAPRTEYLLADFADELRASWSARAA